MAIKSLQALVLTDESKLDMIPIEDSFGAEDNGGYPDGDLYILPDATDCLQAISDGAYIATVWQADYDHKAYRDNLIQFSQTGGEGWSGIQDCSIAWFLDRRDAELCQEAYDLIREDDDLETLAYRYNTPREEWVLSHENDE